MGKGAAGTGHLCRAVELVEEARRRFETLEEVRLLWSDYFGPYYKDCGGALSAMGRPGLAFQAIETGRARAFLNLLAERRLRLASLPPERAAENDRLDAEYDEASAELDRLRAVQGAAEGRGQEGIRSLEGKLREILRRKERNVLSAAPVGSIRYPAPLTLEETRSHLDPGTVLIFYSVGEAETLLFAIGAADFPSPGWTAVSLPVGAAQLGRRVEAFRQALIGDRNDTAAQSRQGKALYDLLVRPAEPLLQEARRILVSPDGPLHTLPFAALVRDGRYLIEWRPLHFALSASAYAEIRDGRPSPGGDRSRMRLVAIGEPSDQQLSRKEAAAIPDRDRRRALRKGLAPLPSSRAEVEAIARLFPQARLFLGREATEEQAKAAARGADLLHIAVHGLLDERAPMSSALVLSFPERPIPGEDNGLLEAWEVMELPLEADLVVLSACNTALGREFGGEGLVGMTRAFQYAGARSVLATLWEVTDRSTPGFMVRFYEGLRAGMPKDEALRAAQLSQLGEGRGSRPFYWAAFQLYGDWE